MRLRGSWLPQNFIFCAVEQVDAAMERHRDSFIRDSNLGLAKQAFFLFQGGRWWCGAATDFVLFQARDAVCSRNIQGLTQTYVTLSLSDIAQQVHLADASAAKHKVNLVAMLHHYKSPLKRKVFECRLWP